MPLTDGQIRKAKPLKRAYKLSDAGGLYLLVTPNGSKLWRLKYRYGGKEKLLALGKYPTVTLAQARLAREEAKSLLAEGHDPSEKRRAAKQERADEGRTFRALADRYLEKKEKEGRRPQTLRKNRWLLDLACKGFGDLPANQVKAAVILEALTKIEREGTFEKAANLKTVVGSVLRYGISLGWLEADPTPALRNAIAKPRPKSRAAITDPEKFGELLRAIETYQGQPTTRIGLQLLALLVPRPGELRQAKWGEFDLEKAVWRIPADRMKMGEEHRVPLPEAAITLLRALQAFTGNGEFILPALTSNVRPMSENTLNQALRRMGFGKEEHTSHGFRATFSTMANESGHWNPDAIERALAHAEPNAVRKAYARSAYWDERVRMADWWANFVMDLVGSI